MFFSLSSMAAEGERPNVNFNHDQTTFPLRGLHSNTACESCHINGVFKGTPNTCEGCHSRGGASTAKLKPANHIPTITDCSSCHIAQSWLPARFSHSSLTQSCLACHNGTSATGKPSTHIITTASCDVCHRTTAWFPAAGFDHVNLGGKTCVQCHNGSTATGKPAKHIPTIPLNRACSDCHLSTSSWLPALFTHSSPPGTCSGCHNGSTATGKPSGHVRTTLGCDSCHTTGTTAWLPAIFTHAPTDTDCKSCHNGTNATGKPAGHVTTAAQCSVCHTGGTSSWAVASGANHIGVTSATICSTCHGVGAIGKPSTHIAITLNCSACHRTTAWVPATFSHTGALQACTVCHQSGPATKPSATHWSVTGVACNSCHNTSAWVPVITYTHNSGTGFAPHSGPPLCKSCHTANSSSIPNAHLPGSCSACHTANFKAGSHIRTQSPTRVLYTAAQLHDCTGACHEYTNNTFTVIKTNRTGHHRSTDGGF